MNSYIDQPATDDNFDETAYLIANPDVAKAVQNGSIASGRIHYDNFGKREGRKLRFPSSTVPEPQQDQYFEMRLAYLKDRICLYRPFLRPAAAEAMNSAIFGENFAGSTDPAALSLLVAFCAITQPVRMLELGTFHGFSTLTIAEILATNRRPGILVTVEPVQEYQERAKELISRSGLASTVRFVCGLSTDEATMEAVGEQAPYDIIYIDSSHSFEATLQELDLYLIQRALIRPGGLVFLHDITLQIENDRGVGPAVDQWIKLHPEYIYLPLSTKGIWPQQAGFGIIQTPTG